MPEDVEPDVIAPTPDPASLAPHLVFSVDAEVIPASKENDSDDRD